MNEDGPPLFMGARQEEGEDINAIHYNESHLPRKEDQQ